MCRFHCTRSKTVTQVAKSIFFQSAFQYAGEGELLRNLQAMVMNCKFQMGGGGT